MTLHVINPNSNRAVTEGIDAAMAPLRGMGAPIACHTLAEGPRGIESQRDADFVITPLCGLVERLEPSASGFVVACFSDPGLHAVRQTSAKPVMGIMESGLLTAMTLGQRIGIIAILLGSIPRHMRVIGGMGIGARICGERALGLTVAELGDGDRTAGKMAETGRALRDMDGADVLVMGCAGMAQYRDMLEEETGLPVVEPCQAAAVMCIGQIMLGR